MKRYREWAKPKARSQRLYGIAIIVGLLLIALVMYQETQLYLSDDGASRGADFPRWLPISVWIVEVTVVANAGLHIFRGNDARRRQAALEGGVVAGGIATFLVPVLVFIARPLGFNLANAFTLLLAAATAAGVIAYHIRLHRRRP